ncbi:MAG: hypothetical protein AB7O79_03785 [Xanthobacteraceae bacterium]|jgi:hypothetical protein
MTDEGRESSKTRPDEVAAYIAVLTAEMVRLARSHKLSELAYLLDLARMEAMQQRSSSSEQGRQRIG